MMSQKQAGASRKFNSPGSRWRAVVERDRRADGHFYYSVKTTGVYCNPSCSARRPHRRNAQFHNSCEAAERAGFRACKRCQPSGATLTEQYHAKILVTCRILEAADEWPGLDQLARQVGMSKFHFQRVFRQVVGLTPKAYAMAQRERRVRTELTKSPTVTQAIYEAGYTSSSRFYEKASDRLGMAPKTLKGGGAGETIVYAIGDCALGQVLVASSNRGVCAISIGNSPAELLQQLRESFPKARLQEGDAEYARTVATVIRFIEKPQAGLGLPLDIRGTVFQQLVWKALQAIPAGVTTTYSDLARRIGSPKAVRAVAKACATNNLAVAIPCHRVLRRDGSLSGYRWGVVKKQALLRRERTSPQGSGWTKKMMQATARQPKPARISYPY